MKRNIKSILLRALSYILVAALASGVTWFAASMAPSSKLEQLSSLIDRKFIGQTDKASREDAAAAAMVDSLGDRWSVYIPADQYAAHVDNQNNEYVGVGITIQKRADGKGFDILKVEPEGPSQKAGILAGDILTHLDGQPVTDLEASDLRQQILGQKDTQVRLRVLRGDQTLDFSVARQTVHRTAAEGKLLEDNVGLVTITNFHTGAGAEIIEQVDALVEQGAQALIFDVRDNPGGFVEEMVQALDHLLPEGILFQSVDYKGAERVDRSDAACLELPMAVLINAQSYSAAELFAAALSEYDWAVTVGQPTTGKGYFQYTLKLMDGSAVSLSTGKYVTPKGVSLAETGGMQPDIPVEAAADGEDLQLLAAVEALTGQ